MLIYHHVAVYRGGHEANVDLERIICKRQNADPVITFGEVALSLFSLAQRNVFQDVADCHHYCTYTQITCLGIVQLFIT